MAKEIERKFLIDPQKWDWKGIPVNIIQAYLLITPEKVIRIRIAGEKAFLTIKGNPSRITRDEFEYAIPIDDAREMLKLCQYSPVEKTRYIVDFESKKWEVDIFLGKNKGLFLAEIEMNSEEEIISLPPWIITDVSNNQQYYNSSLAKNPFSEWQ
jgi:adenylate cyclase